MKRPLVRGAFSLVSMLLVNRKGRPEAPSNMDAIRQCIGELWMLPNEASLLQFGWDCTLTFEQEGGHASHGQVQCKTRHCRGPMGAVQNTGQTRREQRVGGVFRRDDIERPLRAVVGSRPNNESNHIVDVNPTHGLFPDPKGSTKAEFVDGEKFLERSAVGSQHQPKAHLHQSTSQRFTMDCCAFPSVGDFCQKSRARFRLLIAWCRVMPIDANGRRLDPRAAEIGFE